MVDLTSQPWWSWSSLQSMATARLKVRTGQSPYHKTLHAQIFRKGVLWNLMGLQTHLGEKVCPKIHSTRGCTKKFALHAKILSSSATLC